MYIGLNSIDACMVIDKRDIKVQVSSEHLEGDLVIPHDARAIIIFAHGSGSSRLSMRNKYVSDILNRAGFATLLVDLLTQKEKQFDEKTRHLRFDISLLTERLLNVTDWVLHKPETVGLKIGYFGSSTGAAAALVAASKLGNKVEAIISRGGRPDMVDQEVLSNVVAPTLLVVGSNDISVVGVSRSAIKNLTRAKDRQLAIIPGAGHLFEEPGMMEQVAEVSAEWYGCYMLRSGKKFENKYNQKTTRLFSFLREKTTVRFKDRTAAGEVLASLLQKYGKKNSGKITVIGIPRGGVLVADAIARKLDAELDIVFPRKLRSPNNSEYAIGAVMQDGSMYLDSSVVEMMEVSNEYLEIEKSEQNKEILRRMRLYRPDPQEYHIRGRTVILVDDGAATGATIIASARWLGKQEPLRLIIALPVIPKQTVGLLNNEADRVEVLKSSSDFKTVAQFYQDFREVTDEQVIQIMKRNQSQ